MSDKKKLLSFIERYNLAGAVEAVELKLSSGGIGTRFITEDKTVIGEVSLNNFEAPESNLCVYTTSNLVKLMSALDDSVDIKLNGDDKKTYSIVLSDSNTSATYLLSDPSIIPQSPNLKSLPEFDIVIKINKDFASKFIKAKNALPDSDNFAIESKNGETNIIINYSSVNTNRVKFKVTTEKQTDMNPVCFSAKLFKEILTANSDCEGTLEVSSKGLSKVTLTNKEYHTTYYLVKLSVS